MYEIKFRLIKDGEIVGYEKHHKGRAKNVNIMHSEDNEDWWNIHLEPKYYIDHDSKEQYWNIMSSPFNRKELYEGDILKINYQEADNLILETMRVFNRKSITICLSKIFPYPRTASLLGDAADLDLDDIAKDLEQCCSLRGCVELIGNQRDLILRK